MLFYSLPDIALIIACAIIVDWIVGDPRWPTHPVIYIGRLIKAMEKRLYPPEDAAASDRAMLLRGTGLTAAVTLLSCLVMLAIVWAASLLHPLLAAAVHVWFISTTIAVKGLKDAAMLVFRPLAAGNLPEARKYAGYIVSRDTSESDERETARAAVETVAENTVDALVSPVIFALLGGAPLAMLYRAGNTLDSMVGYRNDRYNLFGRASARLDDVLNFIPARLTGLMIALAAVFCRGLSPIRALRAWAVFAHRHPSPNSGIPESAVAGALGIELGGVNRYFGRTSERARLGWPLRPLEPSDIVRTVKLLYGVSIICAAGGGLVWLIAS